MNIDNYKYGDNYINCLSKGVELMSNLKSNRITQSGVEGLNDNIQILNISDNNISKMGIYNLTMFLT